jgi:hypothetical protein
MSAAQRLRPTRPIQPTQKNMPLISSTMGLLVIKISGYKKQL